jgi:uncharacterized protein
MQASSTGTIPTRPFGRTSDKVSALGLGGHHLGQANDEETGIRIVHEAIGGGVTFFDNCWEYLRGETELWMGKALKGKRKNLFLMTKVCTHGRDANLAMQMLDQSLHRLQTDYLDLWQIHGVSFENDAELFIRPNGAAEALRKAKESGRVRYVGFTGHKDPRIHLKMLETGFPFDSVQMPLNVFDAGFIHSFERDVLPVLNQRGVAVLGMKPMVGHGEAIKQGVASAGEMLRYAMSLPVTTTITGMEKIDVLRQNLRIAQNFEPMSAAEMQALRDRCKPEAADARFELYKVSLKFDNPEARLTHDFPLDDQQIEVKIMMNRSKNTGLPYPQVK